MPPPSDPRWSVRRADVLRWTGATLLWMFATAGPVIWLRRRWTLTGDLAEDPWYVVVVLAVGVVCAVAADRRRLADRRLRPTLVTGGVLVAALTLSAAWSLDPGYTFTHGLRLVATVAAALVLVTRFSVFEQMATLWIAVHVGCLWSLLDIRRLVPGSQDDDENWVGIFVNRNLLGLVCAVGISVGVLLAVHVTRTWTGRPRLIALVVLAMGIVVDLYLLQGSRSATPVGALVLLAIGILIVLGLRRLRPIGRRTVTVLAAAVVAGVAASALVLPHVAGLAGRSSELSRRRPLWDFVLDRIADRPLWGWGYLGPWDDRGFRRELRTYVTKAWDLHTAHNSTLEVALGAGLVTLIVFLVFLVFATRSAISGALRPGVLTLWPLVGVAWFMLESLTETFLVADTLPTLLLFVGALVLLPGDDPVETDRGSSAEVTTLASQTGEPYEQ